MQTDLPSPDATKSDTALSNVHGMIVPTVLALLTALFVPVVEAHYRSIGSHVYSALQCCWATHMNSATVSCCILIVLLPVVALVLMRMPSLKQYAYIPLVVGALIGLCINIVGEDFFEHRKMRVDVYGGFFIYAIFCAAGALLSFRKMTRWDNGGAIAALCLTAFISYMEMPFIVKSSWFIVDGHTIIENSNIEEWPLWVYLFTLCPLIAAAISLKYQTKKSCLICAGLLLLPWPFFLSGISDEIKLSSGIILYLLSTLGVAAIGLIGYSSSQSAHKSDSDVRLKIPFNKPSFLNGVPPIGIVLIVVALLDAINSFVGVYVSFGLVVLTYGALAFVFRKSLNKITLAALIAMIVLNIIDILLYEKQVAFFENGEINEGHKMMQYNMIVIIINWVAIFLLPVNERELTSKMKLVFWAFPVFGLLKTLWISSYVFGIVTPTEQILNTVNSLVYVIPVICVVVAIALGVMMKKAIPCDKSVNI